MTVRGIGLAALVLIWPCSAVAQTTFITGDSGALVCDSPKPLNDYKTVFKDAEARGRYLSSEAAANCQLVPKNRTLEPFDPKAAFVSPTEVVRLREKGDRKSWYTLRGEWHVSSPELAAELAAMAQGIRACIQPKWTKSEPVPNVPPDMIVKVRLRLNPDGRSGTAPEVMNSRDDPKFRSLSDKAIKAAQACEPFKLPREKYELWKDMVLNFDPREIKKRK